MDIDIQTRRLKGTPYKFVITKNWRIIGIFDNNKYIEKKNMSEVHRKAEERFHAGTFAERMTHV